MNWLISKKWTACLITSVLLFSTTVAQTSFSNVGPSAGVNAFHITTSEQMGGGVALFDFNNDDLIDILYTGGNNSVNL